MSPSDSTRPDFRVLEASQGFLWLGQSLALLRSQAARLLIIALLMQLVLSLVQLPLLGIIVVLSVPALTAGILEAFHRAALKKPPSPLVLFAPLMSPPHLGRFFATGALLIVISILCVSFVLGSTTQIDETLLMRLQQGDATVLEEIDPGFMVRLFAALAISLAVGGTLTFFSIPLVWFRNYRLGRSLVQGIKALMANWRPMLALGLALLLVTVPLMLLSAILLQMAAAGPLMGSISMGLLMALLLLFQLLLFGTQYCSFSQIFVLEISPKEPPSDGDDGQLLA